MKTFDDGYYVIRDSLPDGSHTDKYVLIKIDNKERILTPPLETVEQCQQVYALVHVK
jgi:hypothetical protein